MKDGLLPYCFAFQGSSASRDAIPFFALVACSVIVGICTILAGAKIQSTHRRSWLIITSGVLRAVLIFPLGIFVLTMIVAGAIEIAAAIRLRKHITGTVFLALAGICSMSYFPGLLLVWTARLPVAARDALTFTILGGLTILFGVCSLTFGLMMRSPVTPRHDE